MESHRPGDVSNPNGGDDISVMKEMTKELHHRIASARSTHHGLISSLQTLLPDLVSSLDISLQLISAFNNRPFVPTPNPNPPNQSTSPTTPRNPKRRRSADSMSVSRHSPEFPFPPQQSSLASFDDSGGENRLLVVRTMVAVCLLERVPFTSIDSTAILRKIEGEKSSSTDAEKAALIELGGESGTISAVEMALRYIAEENSGVELDEFTVSGKTRIMVLGIDRNRLLKELPETAQQQQMESAVGTDNQSQSMTISGVDADGGLSSLMPQPSPDTWMGHGGDPHMSGMMHMYHGGGPMGPMMGIRGGPRGMSLMGMPRMMGMPPLHRQPTGQCGSSPVLPKPKSEEDDMKDLEVLLNKKSFRELQKSKTGEELLDLIHRPTARETAVAAKFKTKGGSQLKEYCTNLTKEDCRRQTGSYIACEKVHFRRIIAPHTDMSLGDCSFLDTCRHMKTCKYVHYELDPTPDVPSMMMGAANFPPRPLKQRAEYCSEVELGEPQWINCDIRNFRMDILGQFGVIMADPPWDIHMELPYGTMADDEMRTLNVPALQTDGLIFLWVTGRAMELGRECLELWGYKRVEEIIWVKTNQLQRIIRTGRTGHWLNHSKEHCLVGIKGSPLVNRNIDTDILVAEVRETSRKPDEMYPLLERISPRTRKLELFARMHNTHAGWMSLGNQLNGARLVDEGLRARFKAAYPEIEIQPTSPPRTYNSMDVESNATPIRSPFANMVEASQPEAYTSEEKPSASDVEMAG